VAAATVGRGGTPQIPAAPPANRPTRPKPMYDGTRHATTAQTPRPTPETDARRTAVGAVVAAALFPAAVFALTHPGLTAAAAVGYAVARLVAAVGAARAGADADAGTPAPARAAAPR